jgi:hypothetical protein
MSSYVTLQELRDYIGVTDNVSASDADLTRAISAASAKVDGWCGREFNVASTATAKVYSFANGSSFLPVNDIATSSGLIVESSSDYSTWTVITADWHLGPLQPRTGHPYTELLPNYPGTCWWGTYARVTASYGWVAVPDGVKQATLLVAHKLYRRKSSPTGVEGVSDFGPVRVSRTDPDVSALLSDFDRRIGIA